MRRYVSACLTLALSLSLGAGALAGEFLANGSFETGDFTGWTADDTGGLSPAWAVSSTGSFVFFTASAQDGSVLAWNGFDGSGPFEARLFQDVAIPAATAPVLSWMHRLQWDFTLGGQPSAAARTLDVQIRDTSDNVLQTVFTFSTGTQAQNPTGDTGWVTTTADLSAYAGSTIRLYFLETVPEALTGPGLATFDAISIATQTPVVDAVARSAASPTNATSVDYAVTFSEAVTGVDSTDFTVTTVTGDATGAVSSEPTTSDNIAYTVTVSSVTGDGTLRLDVNSSGTGIQNGALEALDGGYTSGEEYTIDNTAPAVVSVSSPTPDGTWGAGASIAITVTFDDVVTVDTGGGTPSLLLDMDQTDRAFSYGGGGGTNTLSFTNTVQQGDNTGDLDYVSENALSLNGGTIRDAVGNDATLTLPTPGAANSLSANKDIVIVTNQTPVADDQTVSVTEDESVAITLTASDGDNDPLAYTVGGVSNGALTGTAPNLTYTPTADYAGVDSITFTVNDGTVDSADGTVSITVNAVNDAPTLDAISDVSVDEDNTPSDITLTGIDEGGGADEDTQTVTLTATSSDPSVLADPTITGSTLSFATPVADANGTATVTVTGDDGQGADNTVTRTFTVTVNAVNDTPALVTTGAQATDEDTPLTVTVNAPDVDGETVTFTAESDNVDVVATLANATSSAVELTMTATADYNGSANITVTADDGTATANATASETFVLTVNAVNDAPVADALSVSTSEDISVAITLTASDVDLDTLTYTVTTQPSSGTLTGTAPSLTYAPNAQYNGSDSFTFTANDGTVDSASATVGIAVAAVNDSPAALHRTVSTTEGVALTFTVTGFDGDGDPVTYAIASPPSHGVVTGDLPSVTYTPDADFAGQDVFTYTVSDGAASTSAGVTILIKGVNSAPVLDALADISIVANGSETIVLLTGVLGGRSADEAGQAVTVTATSSDTALLPDPVVAVDDAGTPTLLLTAPEGSSGEVVVTLTLTDDGPTGGSHVNRSTAEFSVVVGQAAIQLEEATVSPSESVGAGDQVTVTVVAHYADSATYSIGDVPRATDRPMAANALADGRTRFTGVFIVNDSDPHVAQKEASVTVAAAGVAPVSVVAVGSVTIGTVDVVDTVAEIDSVTVTPDVVTNGAELTITVVGEPASDVTVDLSALDSTRTAAVTLTEDPEAAGTYTGSAVVSAENTVENGAVSVVARLADAAGNVGELAVEVTLDNAPPPAGVPGATLSLAQGLNLIHVPAGIEEIASAGDLHAFLGGPDVVSAIIAPNSSGRFVAYAQGVGQGSAADFAIESYSGVFVQMKAPKSVVFEGAALSPTVRLHRGINVIGVPRDGAIARIGDLYDISSAVQRIVRHSGGRFIAVVSDDTDADVTVGAGYIVVTSDTVELTLDGEPWLSTPAAVAAPGLMATGPEASASMLVALGRVTDVDGGAPLDGLLARVTAVSDGSLLEDTVGATAGSGQFQAAFFDPSRPFRVGDTLELALSDPTGAYRVIAPVGRTVTADDLRNGTLPFGEITLSRASGQTALLPNYPNPFNPETWIPFELNESADVTVTIYNVHGSAVRAIELGARAAGTYSAPDRAAYWDGRNDDGETVGSGVYFAELKAGDTRRTQRLVLLK